MPRFQHLCQAPLIDLSAWVAPTAVLCGDVRVGPGCAVSHGAVLDAGDGTIVLGHECVVMENAVIKAGRRAPVRIGDHVLVGPRAYLTGCMVEDEVFLATGSTVFNLATVGRRAEVRINGVVHLRTRLPPDAIVPIGWVAVGDPAEILPPDEHERIWAIQKPLDFPRTVFGLERPPPDGTIMPELTRRYAAALRRHAGDQRLTDEAGDEREPGVSVVQSLTPAEPSRWVAGENPISRLAEAPRDRHHAVRHAPASARPWRRCMGRGGGGSRWWACEVWQESTKSHVLAATALGRSA